MFLSRFAHSLIVLSIITSSADTRPIPENAVFDAVEYGEYVFYPRLKNGKLHLFMKAAPSSKFFKVLGEKHFDATPFVSVDDYKIQWKNETLVFILAEKNGVKVTTESPGILQSWFNKHLISFF